MSIIHNYCITGRNFNFLNNLNMNIILAGSDDKNLSDYPDNWIKDNNGLNISNKNAFLHFEWNPKTTMKKLCSN